MKKLVLGVALAGLSTLAMAQQKQMPSKWSPEERKMMMEKRQAQHMAEMQKDLNLTPSQVTQIQAVHDRFQNQRETQRMANQQLRKQKMEGIRKDKQQMDDEMRKILTPEQYQKWQTNRQERMNKMKQNMHMKDKGMRK